MLEFFFRIIKIWMAFLNLFLTVISGQYRKTYAIIYKIHYLNQIKINPLLFI